jgi:hypothetical protein
MVINARQFGHIRLFSTVFIVAATIFLRHGCASELPWRAGEWEAITILRKKLSSSDSAI